MLDTLLEQGLDIPFGCKSGVCQSCLMRATKGQPPEQSQQGLKETLKAQHYFLACSCHPSENLNISLPVSEDVRSPAIVTEIQPLAASVFRLRLKPQKGLLYHAGQYVTLWRDEHIGRSYSLASVPELDRELEFHIRYLENGAFSAWARDTLKPGDEIAVQGPAGDCFYVADQDQHNFLLAGTGTGLAPLLGIARDILNQGVAGEVHLVHGGLQMDDLYLHEKLTRLADKHEQFHYHACVLNGPDPVPGNVFVGDIADLLKQVAPDPSGWKAYLCGAPELVQQLRKQLFLAGCDMKDIYADAFEPSVAAAG